MPTLHVRKSGSDANTYAQAQSPATAWLTIDKAANEVVAGDTVYVGAGVYREIVTMDTAGTNDTTGRISFIADIDGAQTGDAGLVVISAHDSDTGTATRSSCWNITAALDPTFITVRGFTMQGGSTATIYHGSTGDMSYEGLIIEDCAILGGADAGDYGIRLDYNAGVVPTGDGLRIRRCHIDCNSSGVYLRWDENPTVERDIDALIENCVITAAGLNVYGVYWDLLSTSTYDLVGLKIYNNTFYGCYAGIQVDSGSSTTSPILAYNNLFQYANQGIYGATTPGMVTSDYNTFIGIGTPYTNVTQGANDRTNSDTTEVPPVLLGGIADHPFRSMLGWSPWLPWEPIYITGMTQSVIGDGSATYAPADDMYQNPRPMGADGVTDNADDRGAVETRQRPAKETGTVRTGSNAINFRGAGYHDFLIPVAAQSTTITIYGRFDANYAGTLPSMTVTNDDLMTEVTDTMTVAAGNWEQLTSGAFTPSAAGIVRVRIRSSDTSTTGYAFFDDLEVS